MQERLRLRSEEESMTRTATGRRRSERSEKGNWILQVEIEISYPMDPAKDYEWETVYVTTSTALRNRFMNGGRI